MARDVCPIHWQLCASPAYLAGIAPIQQPADLAACRFLCPPYTSRRFLLTLGRDTCDGPEREDVDITPYLQSEHFPFLMNAVRQGHGISLLPLYMTWEDVRRGTLVPVLPDWKPKGLGNRLYIFTTANPHLSMATRALISFLRETVAELDVFKER